MFPRGRDKFRPLLAISLLAAAGMANAATYHVSSASGSDENTGGVADPFATIQKALTEANATVDADTILVEAGSYVPPGPLAITNPTTIIGAQAGVSPLSEDGLRTAGSAEESVVRTAAGTNVFVIASSDVTIEGLDLGGSITGSAIVTNGVDTYSNIRVADNFVLKTGVNGESGILLIDVEGAVVERNFVSGFPGVEFGAIGLRFASNSTVTGNEVTNTGQGFESHGIAITGDSVSNTVSWNFIHTNIGKSGIRVGETAEQSASDATIFANRIRDFIQNGISVRMPNVLIEANEIYASTDSEISRAGIYLREDNVADITIRHNYIHDNQFTASGRNAAIRIESLAPDADDTILIEKNYLVGNLVQDNNRAGFGYDDDQGGRISVVNNWWGHSSGPSTLVGSLTNAGQVTDACDNVTTTLDGGLGDGIGVDSDSAVQEVCFTPWALFHGTFALVEGPTTVKIPNSTTDTIPGDNDRYSKHAVTIPGVDAATFLTLAPASDRHGVDNAMDVTAQPEVNFPNGLPVVTVQYDDSETSEAEMSLAVFNNGSWHLVPGSVVDTAENTVSAPVASLNATYAAILSSTVCETTVSPEGENFTVEGGSSSISVISSCDWTAESTVDWIVLPCPLRGEFSCAVSGSGDDVVEFDVLPNSGNARTGYIIVGGASFEVTQEGVPCDFTVDQNVFNVSFLPSQHDFAVSTSIHCEWTAIASEDWVTVTSGSGPGSGTVEFEVAENTGAARQATITVEDQIVTINQEAAPCDFTVEPVDFSVAFSGSSESVTVTTSDHCDWTAVSNDAWITVTSGASSTGSGTVEFDVEANAGGERIGTLTVAGETITVTQAAAPCDFVLNQTEFSVPAGLSNQQVTVTTGVHCDWDAVSNDAWITIVSGGGPGSGNVQFQVAANAGDVRVGTITVAGETVTVTQAAAPCVFVLDQTLFNVPSGISSHDVGITAAAHCDWTAVTNDEWIVLLNNSGSGNGLVAFNVTANTGAARVGTLTVAGQTVTVSQEAAPCNFVVDQNTFDLPASASQQMVGVLVEGHCDWTPVASASWITIVSGNGPGDGVVVFDVAENVGPARSATITIGDKVVTVSQESGCAVALDPADSNFTAEGGDGSFTITVSSQDCPWTVESHEEWIEITSATSGTGDAVVTFTVAANSSFARTGVITVGDEVHTVTQDENPDNIFGFFPGNYFTPFDGIGISGVAGYPDLSTPLAESLTNGVQTNGFVTSDTLTGTLTVMQTDLHSDENGVIAGIATLQVYNNAGELVATREVPVRGRIHAILHVDARMAAGEEIELLQAEYNVLNRFAIAGATGRGSARWAFKANGTERLQFFDNGDEIETVGIVENNGFVGTFATKTPGSVVAKSDVVVRGWNPEFATFGYSRDSLHAIKPNNTVWQADSALFTPFFENPVTIGGITKAATFWPDLPIKNRGLYLVRTKAGNSVGAVKGRLLTPFSEANDPEFILDDMEVLPSASILQSPAARTRTTVQWQ